MDPVKLGVIGCGVIGSVHLHFATQSSAVKVVAIADLIKERVEGAAAKFDIDKVYADGDALINDPEIEAVTLAFPAVWRTPLALRALARGKHVLIEKPIAMNAQEVEHLIAARGDRTVACC
jgi:predicted dehydrogenase